MDKIIKDAAFLRQTSEPVKTAQEAQELIDRLTAVLDKHSDGIGLSAVQIGVPKRVCVIQREHDEDIHIINPTICQGVEEFSFRGEGCLSFPGQYTSTKRFKHFSVKHQIILDGELKDQELYFYYSLDKNEQNNDGIYSIAVQHEIDHLDGVLFFDKEDTTVAVPIVNDKKVGRNDPCPCGSKKNDGTPIKYKKCCGR